MPKLTKPRILAVANQKGGVGKTTTAINLGTALAAIGERVIILDLDPQGNASTGLGVDIRSRRYSTYDILLGERTIEQAALETAVPRLRIVPSTLDLLGLDLLLANDPERSRKLSVAVSRSNEPVNDRLSATYILIDCPPSLSLVTVNAFVAAHAVLVPLQCEFFSLEGLSQLLRTIEDIRVRLNPALSIHGIILTMYDPRNSLANQVVADVREYLGEKVYETVIPRNVRVSEAPSHGKPVLLYDLRCAGSQAYLRLASEVLHREAKYLCS